jgi:hypothetical protein
MYVRDVAEWPRRKDICANRYSLNDRVRKDFMLAIVRIQIFRRLPIHFCDEYETKKTKNIDRY